MHLIRDLLQCAVKPLWSVILKLVLRNTAKYVIVHTVTMYGGVYWIHLAQDNHWRALVDTEMNLRHGVWSIKRLSASQKWLLSMKKLSEEEHLPNLMSLSTLSTSNLFDPYQIRQLLRQACNARSLKQSPMNQAKDGNGLFNITDN
jgi:hypothetical protein